MNFSEQEKSSQLTTKEAFVQDFWQCFTQQKKKKSVTELVFICIGTDRIIGDCLGPLVGTKLEEKLGSDNIANLAIYGTLKENISYTNMKEKVTQIQKKHPYAYLIIIDAALSQEEQIGKIFVKQGQTILGKALNKTKIKIGDLSIKAVVGKNYKLPKHNFSSLQNVSLNSVIILAEIIAEGICEVIQYI